VVIVDSNVVSIISFLLLDFPDIMISNTRRKVQFGKVELEWLAILEIHQRVLNEVEKNTL
jgi:hypothetical protein